MVMDWNQCEREFIRHVEPDIEQIRSILAKSRQRLKRARETKVTEESISFIVEDYYEVMKEFLIAYLLKSGLRSKNHQCLISYFLKKNPRLEKEAVILAQMSFFRNRLEYYGEGVPTDFYYQYKDEFEKMITILEKLFS